MPINRDTLAESFRYLLVSGSGVAVNLATFAIARTWRLPALVCGALAFVAACQHNEHWHARVTFSGKSQSGRGRPVRFFVLSLATLGVNLAILPVLEWSGLAPVVAEGAAIAVACPLNYLGSRLWVFVAGPSDDDAAPVCIVSQASESEPSPCTASYSERAYARLV